MRQRLLFILALLAASLAACAGGAMTTPTPTGGPGPDEPVSATPGGTPPPALTPAYAPQPGDEALTRGKVFLDESQLLILESFPVQVHLQLKGSLPTPCHLLRVKVGEPDGEGKIAVEVYALVDPGKICAQVLQPFEQVVPLTPLPDGDYSVSVNGGAAMTFSMPGG